jgi:hypothetical protein
MVARVLLLYSGSAGPPRLRWCGCTVPVSIVARGCGRRDLEGGPLWRTTWASAMVGDILHPRQAVAYMRGRSMMVVPDLGLVDFDLGSQFFYY